MTVDLDTRMRAAGDSLARASERLSPAAPPRSLRPLAGVVAVVVAAVALAAGTVTVLAVNDGDGESTVASGSAVARLVPDVVPEGVRPAGVVELPTDDAAGSGQSISVYGDPSTDDPFAESDLAILTTPAPLLYEEGGETVDVRGHDGLVTDALPVATTVLWEEAEGLTVSVASRTLDVDQLVSIAEGLAVDADAGTVDVGSLPDGLPGPLERVAAARVDDVSFGIPGIGLPVRETTTGHVAAYVPDEYQLFGHAFVRGDQRRCGGSRRPPLGQRCHHRDGGARPPGMVRLARAAGVRRW